MQSKETQFKPGQPPLRAAPKKVLATCEHCLEEFQFESSQPGGRRYCSDRCREAAKYHRRKAKKRGYDVTGTHRVNAPTVASQVERKAKAEERLDRVNAAKQERAERSLALLREARELADMGSVAPRELLQKVVAKVALEHMTTAMQVLAGEKKWDAQQAMIFKVLMNKMMPDARVADMKREQLSSGAQQRFSEMSLDELEATLAQVVEGSVVNETEGADEQDKQDG